MENDLNLLILEVIRNIKNALANAAHRGGGSRANYFFEINGLLSTLHSLLKPHAQDNKEYENRYSVLLSKWNDLWKEVDRNHAAYDFGDLDHKFFDNLNQRFKLELEVYGNLQIDNNKIGG